MIHWLMQLPRTGQLDDRRRRVLTDEVIGASPAAAPAGETVSRTGSSRRRAADGVRPYGDDVLTDRQPRVTDLIPLRWSMVALFGLAGAIAVAGLETLHAWLPELAKLSRDGRLPLADLRSEGSLASWFSSMVLLLAALASMAVYSIRRHRKDDYHGRYRVWRWTALVWLTLSIDAGSTLHEAFSEVMSYATGRRGWGDGSLWWIGACALLLAYVGGRLLLEMRVCRLSTAALLLAAICYAVTAAARFHWLPIGGSEAVLVKAGCEMAGSLWLLMAMVLHARYVILEADGRLPVKRAKPPRAEKKSQAAAKAESAAPAAAAKRSWFRKTKVDVAHPAVPAPAAKPREASKSVTVTARPNTRGQPADDYDYEHDEDRHDGRASQSSSADDDGYDDETADRRLSKAQRKALRRQKDRHRRSDE
ncbi:MAG TPA: hypothetical protein VFW87_18115 [Pirellulales bacterium]|nr:hypothetical protein [Pirellulales bacterium]